jgi:hypothetical protein
MASSERYAGQIVLPFVNKTDSNSLDGRCFASGWSGNRLLAGNARSDLGFPSEDISLYIFGPVYLLFKA